VGTEDRNSVLTMQVMDVEQKLVAKKSGRIT